MATLKTVRRILLVDEHPIVRQGLRALLEQSLEYAIAGEAANVDDGLAALASLRPDAVILDISLGKDSGLDFIARARRDDTNVAVLVLSMLDEMTYAERALRVGANGYVMKREATDRLLVALERVLAGKVYVSPSVSDRLLTTLSKPGDGARYPIDRLTDRELEIFRLVGMGMRAVDMAERLGISQKTIETHRSRIKAKLGVETAAELVIRASSWLRDGQLKA
ncbi:MAG TPA: response regulator transcription factor [Polyangiaceae bacterium]|nr:response regulator transcription factor [Polyangiaceae bacterium]